MACHLLGDKPLSKPMMTSYPPNRKGQTLMKKYENWPVFIDEIAHKIIICNFAVILPRERWVKNEDHPISKDLWHPEAPQLNLVDSVVELISPQWDWRDEMQSNPGP